jgi:hypothetical protein
MSVSGTVTTLKTDFNLDTGLRFTRSTRFRFVGPRIAGWAADTGTDKRTANATYTAGRNADVQRNPLMCKLK